MTKGRLALLGGIGLAALAAVLLVVAPNYRKAPAPPAAPHYVSAEGKVEAMPGFDVSVGSGDLSGKVEKILAGEGDWVEAGQVVAILQNEDLRARVIAAERELAAARARLEEVRSGARPEEIRQAAEALAGARATLQGAAQDLARFRQLRAQGMVSQAALDDKERAYQVAAAAANAAALQKQLLEEGPKRETLAVYRGGVKVAEAALEHARRVLDKSLIRAPISGKVIRRYVDEGEPITPEIPILDIADTGRIWVNAEVDETDIGRVGVGDRVAITAEAYPGRTFTGRVEQIAAYAGARAIRPGNPAINLGIKVVQVKIGFATQVPFKLGQSVDVRILPVRAAQ